MNGAPVTYSISDTFTFAILIECMLMQSTFDVNIMNSGNVDHI